MTSDIGHFTHSRLTLSGWTFDFGHLILGIRPWALIMALGIYCSCQSKSPGQPSLPDEKIARIMADISIADAATTGLNGYAKDSLMQAYYKQVFEMYGVTLEVYEKDLRILAQDLVRMEGIVKQADELLTEGGNGQKN